MKVSDRTEDLCIAMWNFRWGWIGDRSTHSASGCGCGIVSGMKLTDDKIVGANLVRSYGPGEVRVGESVVRRSCLISAAQLITDWRPQTIEELQLSDIDAILDLEPEIVVLGSGDRQRFPSHEWTAALLARGIGCEVMDTGAASRTYNVLVSEERRVVAAMFVQ